ncbi:phosphotransferase [Streptomyces vinaceus]|uniref:phosphotransferase n=1 Tax=Streptomyces vinaceus TaxID=1960 RepID=UPI003688CD1B
MAAGRLSVTSWVGERQGIDDGLQAEQWRALGAVLAQTHALPVTADLTTVLPVADHTRDLAKARTVNAVLGTTAPPDTTAAAAQRLWLEDTDQIRTVAALVEQLAPRISPTTVCHTDPHLGSVLAAPGHVWLPVRRAVGCVRPGLGQSRRGRQVQPAAGGDDGVVMNRGPRPAPGLRRTVRLVHDHQVPPSQPRPCASASTRSDRYVANTVTAPGLPAHPRTCRQSVVQRTPAPFSSGSLCSEQTATMRPVRPAPRQTDTVCTSRSSVGNRTRTRPARATRPTVHPHQGLACPAGRNNRRPQSRPGRASIRGSPQSPHGSVHRLNLMRPQCPTTQSLRQLLTRP